MTAIHTTPRSRLRPASTRVADRAFRIVTAGSALAVFVVLSLIAWSTISEAAPAFSSEGLGFVTSARWAPSAGSFGTLAFIWGTLFVSFLALAFAVPMSIGIALFVTEYAGRRAARIVMFLIDVLAAVPSVVFGLWGVAVLAKVAPRFYETIGSPLSVIPGIGRAFDSPYNGKSFLTAGFILGLMVTPIITSLTREVFETTPRGQKEAAFALGATRWEMIRGTVLPHSFSGVVGAVLLGLGRAMGETIAAALVIGAGTQVTLHLFASGDALAARVANEFGEGVGVPAWRAALVGLGVVLFAMTVLVNLAAQVVVRRADRRAG